MSPVLALALSLTSMCGTGPEVPRPTEVITPLQQASYAELYRSGLTFSDFLEQAEDQEEEWLENYARDYVAVEMTPGAREIPGNWRLLVVGEDWCSDSVNTIPYLARLTEGVDGLDMRIVNSDEGRWVMEAHPTPDGRPATPTVIVLDEKGDKVGCWSERPGVLQDWWQKNPDNLSGREKLDQKFAWYDEDAGGETLREILEIIKSASDGSPQCTDS